MYPASIDWDAHDRSDKHSGAVNSKWMHRQTATARKQRTQRAATAGNRSQMETWTQRHTQRGNTHDITTTDRFDPSYASQDANCTCVFYFSHGVSCVVFSVPLFVIASPHTRTCIHHGKISLSLDSLLPPLVRTQIRRIHGTTDTCICHDRTTTWTDCADAE